MDFTEFNSQRTRAFPHHPALWGSRCLTVTSLKAANGDTKAVYTPEGCSEIEVSSWELLLLAKAQFGDWIPPYYRSSSSLHARIINYLGKYRGHLLDYQCPVESISHRTVTELICWYLLVGNKLQKINNQLDITLLSELYKYLFVVYSLSRWTQKAPDLKPWLCLLCRND